MMMMMMMIMIIMIIMIIMMIIIIIIIITLFLKMCSKCKTKPNKWWTFVNRMSTEDPMWMVVPTLVMFEASSIWKTRNTQTIYIRL
jgi:hypothetical protein